MKAKPIYPMLFCSLVALIGCDDYLSETPNRGSNEPLNNSTQIEALFNNSDLLDTYAFATAYASDDVSYSIEMYDMASYNFSTEMLPQYVWAIDDLANAGYDNFWEGQFNKVFKANLVLNEIDEVTDLTDATRTEYLAQAHFLRAVAYWQLVNVYCMPYAKENFDLPGLPLKRTTSYEENLERASLRDTYAFIEADLIEAQKTQATDIRKRWLVSQPAVHALLARFYLFTGAYDQAESHAAEALKSQRTTLHDYNELGYVESYVWNSDYSEEFLVNYSELYGYSPLQYTDYQESYYSEMYRNYCNPGLLPSESLVELYDAENDLRFAQFFTPHGSLEYGIEGFGDDLLYRKFYSSSFYNELFPAGPSVPEMLLTRAEALIRQGEWKEGLNVANLLREKRMRSGSDYTLKASNQEEALRAVLDERHREMPFMMRWMDIRRFAYNETPSDDVALLRSFYQVENGVADWEQIKEYTLPVKSKRYAQPLLAIEISRSHGQLVQNSYD